jgi:hypothetical protein
MDMEWFPSSEEEEEEEAKVVVRQVKKRRKRMFKPPEDPEESLEELLSLGSSDVDNVDADPDWAVEGGV